MSVRIRHVPLPPAKRVHRLLLTVEAGTSPPIVGTVVCVRGVLNDQDGPVDPEGDMLLRVRSADGARCEMPMVREGTGSFAVAFTAQRAGRHVLQALTGGQCATVAERTIRVEPRRT